MTYYTKSCPHCRHKYQIHNPTKRQYGSPFRVCERCKKGFIDCDYIEIALLSPRKIRNPKVSFLSIFWLILGFASCLLLWTPGPILNNIALILILVFGIISVVLDLSSYRERCSFIQDELYRSKKRISDPNYILALEEIDYDLLPKQRRKVYPSIVQPGTVDKKSIIVQLIAAFSVSAVVIAGLVLLVLKAT